MALQKTTVNIVPEPLDTKTDPRGGNVRWQLLENVYQRKKNLWALRDGTTSLTRNISGGGSLSTARRAAAFGDELLSLTDTKAYSYAPTLSNWVAKGNMSVLAMTAEPYSASVFSYSTQDAAIVGNLMCLVYEADTAQIHYTIIDLQTGERIVLDTYIGTAGSRPRVVGLASSFAIVYWNNATDIKARTISTATPTTLGGEVALKTDAGASGNFDIQRSGSADSFLLGYHSTTVGKITSICSVTSALAASATVGNADAPDQCMGWGTWDASDGKQYLTYVSSAGGGHKYLTITVGSPPAISATTVLDATTTAARNVTGAWTGITFTWAVEVGGSPSYNTLLKGFKRSVGLAGRMIKVGSNYYIPATYASTLQSTYFLLDINGSVVGKAFYGTGGGLTARTGHIPSLPAIDSTTVMWPTLRLVQTPDASAGAVYTGLTLWGLRLDFSGSGVGAPKRLNENLLVPGGLLRGYDGNSITELGFHLFPENPTLTAGAGGALTVSSTYQYVIQWTWFDGRGQKHTMCGTANSVALGGAQNRVTLTIPTLRLTDKTAWSGGGTGVWLVDIYRTTANGTVFYKITAQASYIMNLTTADTISYVDDAADSSITNKEQLQFTAGGGGELMNTPPPAMRLLEVVGQRAWGVAEDPTVAWYSKLANVAGYGVGFNAGLFVTLDADDGAPTAIGDLEGAAVIFKRSSIYVTSGDGLSNNNTGVNFDVKRLATKVGSVGPFVARTPDGVLYKSATGFYMLTTAQQSVYVGAGVAAYDSLTVTGVVVMDDKSQVRFTTSEGRTLVYDWSIRGADGLGTWTTFVTQAASCATLWKKTFVFIKSDGTAVQEVSGQYNDDGAAIDPQMKTTWITGGDGMAAKRLYELQALVEFKSTCGLTCAFSFDFDEASPESMSYAGTTASKGPVGFQPSRGRFEAFLVTLGASGVAGQRWEFSGFDALIGAKGGTKPAAQYGA